MLLNPLTDPLMLRETATGAALPPDAEYVCYRLEEAGRALLSLPNTGPNTQLRTTRHDVVQSAVEAYGWARVDTRLRPATPTAGQITRMDEALDCFMICA